MDLADAPLRIGGRTGGYDGQYGNTEFTGIIVCGAALSNSERGQAEQWLGAKAGVSIT